MAFEKSEQQQYKEEVSWSIGNCSVGVLLGYTVSYLLYIAAGGFCFLLIEGQGEDNLHEKLQLVKSSFIRRFPNVTGEVLNEFISELSSIGIGGLQASNDTEQKWTYSQSIFFCVTLLTTIGYGHVAPASQIGKAFCIMYSAFGIPFTVILLASWVERLMGGFRRLQMAMCFYARGPFKELSVRLMILGFLAVIISVIFFFIPAYVFQHFEDGWTYLDSLYFCFISLTTVGLGDFVAAKSGNIKHMDLYRIGVTVYLIAGITAITLLMALLAEFKGCIKHVEPEEAPINQPNAKQYSYGSVTVEKTKMFFEDVHYKILNDSR